MFEGGEPLRCALEVQQALEIYRRVGSHRGIAGALNNLGGVAGPMGEYAEARRLYQESGDIFRQIGDRRGMAFVLNNLGHVLESLGEYAEARRLCQESLAVFREIGDRWSIANTLNNLGAVACTLGECADSRQYFREALTIATGLGAIPLVLEALGGSAGILALEAQWERAAEMAAFVRQHPASDSETRGKAERILVEAEEQLSSEALLAGRARGEEKTLEEMVSESITV